MYYFPFILSLFLTQDLAGFVLAALTQDPTVSASGVAGFVGMYHHIWLNPVILKEILIRYIAHFLSNK
jgi:hypothetical protein